MRVAIVHYHLAPGGVTRVIESASQRPDERRNPPRHPHRMTIVEWSLGLPCTEFLQVTLSIRRSELTAADLRKPPRRRREALGGPPDIWHFHNHSLGKNRLLPEVIARLAEADERIVLQIHDLAEARPTRELSAHRGSAGNSIRFPRASTTPSSIPAISTLFTKRRTPPGKRHPPPQSHLFLRAPSRPPRLCGNLFLPPSSSPPSAASAARTSASWSSSPPSHPPAPAFAISRAPRNPDALPVHDPWRKFADQPPSAHRVRRRGSLRPRRRSRQRISTPGSRTPPISSPPPLPKASACPFSKPSPTASRC